MPGLAQFSLYVSIWTWNHIHLILMPNLQSTTFALFWTNFATMWAFILFPNDLWCLLQLPLYGWQDWAKERSIIKGLTLKTLKYVCINHGDQRVFLNLKSSYILVSSFSFIWIPMLLIYGYYKYFYFTLNNARIIWRLQTSDSDV